MWMSSGREYGSVLKSMGASTTRRSTIIDSLGLQKQKLKYRVELLGAKTEIPDEM
jgi:hypothetical protein